MGYVRAELATPNNPVTIDIRGAREPAHSVQMPFYRRTT
jgi:glycine cleavage system aminomethyltransferase T